LLDESDLPCGVRFAVMDLAGRSGNAHAPGAAEHNDNSAIAAAIEEMARIYAMVGDQCEDSGLEPLTGSRLWSLSGP
jgi:hypothetical protein